MTKTIRFIVVLVKSLKPEFVMRCLMKLFP